MLERRFAHYEILGPIGRGGMGEVHKARDLRLGRTVAIKLLPASVSADPERQGRLLREARAAAALSHPNIASLYDVGEAGTIDLEALGAGEYLVPGSGSVPYIVMEFVEGEDLRSRMARQRLPLGEVVELGIQIAQGLAAAHKAGIVHRDLKPANVMLSPEGRPKLLDFGLAKMVGSGDSQIEEPRDHGPLTREGMIVGTVPYMAPEQLQGARADARSDLFSLGVLLYEMIAGEPPYPTRLADFFRALAKEPEPLSSSCPYVAPELAQIVHKLLQREPEDRYQQADDVVRELKALAGGSSGSQELPPGERQTLVTVQTRRLRRRRFLVLAACVVAVLGVLGGVLYWFDYQRAHRTEPHFNLAVLPFENQTGDPNQDYFCHGLSRLLIPKLSRIRGVNAIELNLDATYVITGSVERLVEGRVGVQVRLTDAKDPSRSWAEVFEGERAEVQGVLVDVNKWLLETLRVPISWGESRYLESRFTGSTDALLHYLEGVTYLSKLTPADLKKAEDHLRAAIDYDESFALAHSKLSETLWNIYSQIRRGDQTLLSEAEKHAYRALELDADQPEAQIALAQVFRGKRELEKAENLLKSLTWLYPRLAEAHHQLAITLRREGQLCEAKRSSFEAIRIGGKSWRFWNEYGLALFGLANYDEAQSAFEKAITLTPPGEDPSFVGNAVTSMVRLGNYERAIEFAKSLPDSIGNLSLLNSIGAAYFFTGRLDLAEQYYTRILNLTVESDNRGRVFALLGLGDSLARKGSRAEADEHFSRALYILQTAPDLAALDAESFRLQLEALLLAKLGDCHSALEKGERIRVELPEDADKSLILAKVFALCQQPEKALARLEEAVERGALFSVLRREVELESLVEKPEFQTLANRAPHSPPCP